MSTVTADLIGSERARALAAAPAAVTLDDVSKTFRLPHQRYSTLKERVLHPLALERLRRAARRRGRQPDDRRGEFFGIVGRNGSGKSTLLKCIAGIYRPNRGSIAIDGRLSPFIELGVGFNPDLTARENVIVNAVMLGLSRREARARFDSIVAFAGLEEFLDLKLKNYSSGMSVRLGFSVAIQVDADMLLVDEVLAVGDAAFQHKCYEQFQRLKDEGKTIIFVTHDMGAVERFCDRAMLIERGKVVSVGDPRTIARSYNELNFGRLLHENVESGRFGDQVTCQIDELWFEMNGERVTELPHGYPLDVVFAVRIHQAIEDPVFGISIRNDVGHTVFVSSTQLQEQPTGGYAAGDTAVVRFALTAWFTLGRYHVTPSVARAGTGEDALDLREDMGSVIIHGIHNTGAMVDFPHTIEVQRG